MRYWVFDLDGCLVDTHAAVLAAYRMAGVTMPPGAWGKPVGDWCTAAQHERKNRAYPAALSDYSTPGPAMLIWDDLIVSKGILTGASRAAVDAVLNAYPRLRDAKFIHCGLSRLEKREFLLSVMGDGVYVDDDREAGEAIVEGTAFKFLHVGVLR